MVKKISIVVPIYNQEKYLNKSIPSVLNQTYGDIEIILVNDGSTDSSMEMVNFYAKKDERIKVVNKANGGLVDATLAGIENATGDYIAFLDPDDYWGKDFLFNLIKESDNEDIIASGFYYDFKGQLRPYPLSETKVYMGDELKNLRGTFLHNESTEGIPNTLFFSRWNKIYKKEIVDKAWVKFSECKNITLGEDSIFTYLVLGCSSSVKTIAGINSYYYNIGNQNSMMKTGTINSYITKARLAKDTLLKLIENPNDNHIAYALYYYLIETLYSRTLNSSKKDFYDFRKIMDRDADYLSSIRIISKSYKKISSKVKVNARVYLPKGLYYFEKKLFMDRAKSLKSYVVDVKYALRASLKMKKSFSYELKHKRRRTNAFKDLNEKISLLDERIYPILKKYEYKTTDFSNCPIEKNVFVFWWDGFENAPEIVKRCLASVRKTYSDCRIIEISKENYRDYTNINKIIESDFYKGKISVQTFSDILRFNLLKNNGGLWIDATIFFLDYFPMFEKLKSKSFESLCFSTSSEFFKYGTISCSWSGYFIASRKESVFVNAMNEVFEEYYLKYRDYTIYFFIDAAFMLAKKYGIDNAVLDNIQFFPNDMFLLSKLLYREYDAKCIEDLKKVPQKLAWFSEGLVGENTFYKKVLIEGVI
ncbi:Glycosyl transferase family 2 [Pseudobutyrivibrio sp. OR37]|uniref:capsular polysaccharide synthesis protein n=1 Tax=Pseudobutyrivibrio sp. OR37 TaxID=1798186 RepID=UPI0008E0FF25|nr:capsular polysaccharide synthesis protein [Pseudobutyrivibrio sp. OR37]SFH95972.1 Glycosyl transferase family 2 [Pseudobutyrivibrio sp. OR37]